MEHSEKSVSHLVNMQEIIYPMLLVFIKLLMQMLRDILDKISFGYLCQIITPSTFKQYIACTGLKVRLSLYILREPTLGPNLVMHTSFMPESWIF